MAEATTWHGLCSLLWRIGHSVLRRLLHWHTSSRVSHHLRHWLVRSLGTHSVVHAYQLQSFKLIIVRSLFLAIFIALKRRPMQPRADNAAMGHSLRYRKYRRVSRTRHCHCRWSISDEPDFRISKSDQLDLCHQWVGRHHGYGIPEHCV